MRMDIRVRGLEEPTVVTDMDVRCLYPDARSYSNSTVEKLLENAEKEKKEVYQRLVQAEGNRFRPFVVTTDGVMGPSATKIIRQLGEKLASKWKKPIGTVMGWVRAKIGLAIVRACSACIRGPKIRGGARAWRMEPALGGDESDGAFLGLQFTNGPVGQGRRGD